MDSFPTDKTRSSVHFSFWTLAAAAPRLPSGRGVRRPALWVPCHCPRPTGRASTPKGTPCRSAVRPTTTPSNFDPCAAALIPALARCTVQVPPNTCTLPAAGAFATSQAANEKQSFDGSASTTVDFEEFCVCLALCARLPRADGRDHQRGRHGRGLRHRARGPGRRVDAAVPPRRARCPRGVLTGYAGSEVPQPAVRLIERALNGVHRERSGLLYSLVGPTTSPPP